MLVVKLVHAVSKAATERGYGTNLTPPYPDPQLF